MPLSFVSLRYPPSYGESIEVFFICTRCGGETTQYLKPIALLDQENGNQKEQEEQEVLLPEGHDPSVNSDGLGGPGAPSRSQKNTENEMIALDCPSCDRINGYEPPELHGEQHVKRPRKETFERLEWNDARGVLCVLTLSTDCVWGRRTNVEMRSLQDGRRFHKFKQTITGRMLLRRGGDGSDGNDSGTTTTTKEFSTLVLQMDAEQGFANIDSVTLTTSEDDNNVVFEWNKFFAYSS